MVRPVLPVPLLKVAGSFNSEGITPFQHHEFRLISLSLILKRPSVSTIEHVLRRRTGR